MIRWLLPHSQIDELIALDANLRRGDLLMAGEQLTKAGLDHLPTGALALRQAIYDYLASRHALVLDTTASIQTLTPSPDPTILALSHFLRALAYIDSKQPEEAMSALEMAKTLSGVWPRLLRYSILAQSTLSLYLGRYDEAQKQLDSLVKSPIVAEDVWRNLQVWRIRGLIGHQRTHFSEALALFTEAREGFIALEDQYEAARCDKALANTYRRLDRPAEAEACAQAAVAYFRLQELPIPLARCLNTLGSIQLYFNQSEKALTHFQLAASSLEKTELRPELAHTLGNIGLCYRQLGHSKFALSAYTQARELVAQPHIPMADAMFAEYQADLYWQNGRNNLAIATMHSAIALFDQLEAKTQVARCWRKLGFYLNELGESTEALIYLEKSSRIFLQHKCPAQAALASIVFARVKLNQGDTEAAIPLLTTGAEILRQHSLDYEAAVADVWIGQALLMQKRFAQATDCFQRALNSAPSERMEVSWRAWRGLGKIAIARGQEALVIPYFKRAISHINHLRRGALSPQAAAHFAEESAIVYTEAIDACNRAVGHKEALEILENQKATQLAQQLRSHHDTFPNDIYKPLPKLDMSSSRQLTSRLEQLCDAISLAYQEQAWERLVHLESDYQHYSETLAALNAPYASLYQTPQLDVDQLRVSLNERHGTGKWAVFSYGWIGKTPEILHRFFLNSDAVLALPAALGPIEHQLLRLACHPDLTYRQRLLHRSAPNPAQTSPEWQRLESLLMPAEYTQQLAEAETLYIVPSGPLASFPFAALQSQGQYLGLHFAVSQLPSLPMLQSMLTRSASRQGTPSNAQNRFRSGLSDIRGLVCAVSSFPPELDVPPLPNTMGEAAGLASLLARDSILLMEESANWNTFKALQVDDALRQFELMHFATHAQFHPHHSHLSRLLLSDKPLLVSDILRWNLDAHLVVLAACDTAVGQVGVGDEQMGLPHAFLVAGTDALLAALWPVDDQQTAAMLKQFYTILAKGEQSTSLALLETRRWMAAQGLFPLAWGALTHIGLA